MIFVVQEAGIDGTFWAGWIELAGVDDCESAGELSSGFEWGGGLRPLNISVGDSGGECYCSAIVS